MNETREPVTETEGDACATRPGHCARVPRLWMESSYAARTGPATGHTQRPNPNSIGSGPSLASAPRTLDDRWTTVQQQGTGERIPAEWPPSSYTGLG